MTAAHRPKGRTIRQVKVPTRSGLWRNRTTGTRDRVTAGRMQRMIEELGPLGRQEWEILDPVGSSPPTISVPELWRRWNQTPGRYDGQGRFIAPSVDERIEYVKQSFRTGNVVTLADEWHEVMRRPGSGISRDTADHYFAAVKSYLAWAMEGEEGKEVQLSELTELALSEWIEEMDDVRPATVRKRGIGVGRFTAWLKSRRHLPTDPMEEISLPGAGPPRTHHIDTPLAILLAGAQTGDYWRLGLLLPGTGIEVSTALALRVRNVEKETREIRAAGTKTHNRDRIVRVADYAWPAVLAAINGKHPDALLFDEIPNRFAAGDAHRDAVKALGGKHPILLEQGGYTMRDHRHTWAVRAVRSGWPIEAVGRQLGHKDGVLALRVYGRFQPTQVERDRWERMATERDRKLAKGARP